MSNNSLQSSLPSGEAKRLTALYDNNLCPMDYDLGPAKSATKIAHFGNIHQWGLDVIRDHGFGHREGRRGLEHIRHHPDDNFLLSIPLCARVHLEQGGVTTSYSTGKFAIISTAKPFYAHISAAGSAAPFNQLIVRVAGPILRQHCPDIDDFSAQAFDLKPGAGRLMLGLLELALTEGAQLNSQQATDFSESLIRAISGTLNEYSAQACHALSARRPCRKTLFHHICQFIETNLSNGDLNTDLIAGHFHISPRHLRELFSENNTTLLAFIRERRLAHCRTALRDMRLKHRTITEIALQWGFNDPAHFSRLYSSCFGLTPRDERCGALQACIAARAS